ncbi:MAG: 50S ribosomal protein L11 methyltransferase [Flavobacteriales bacterium]|jgi:ribosomal protein L11 methyltransferase
MTYIEYTFRLNPLLPAREVLVAELAELGFESFVDTEDGLQAYIQSTLHQPVSADNLMACAMPDQEVQMVVKEIADQNWNAEWEKNFEPILVDDKCAVRAPFHNPVTGFAMEIVIEPKMSFGTGHHATTWLMMRALFDLDLKGKKLLDMGSGTGVLAILAEKLGAASCDAIDIDEWAYENALENMQRNGCRRVHCALGGADLLGEKKYDVILANINRNILTRDAAHYLNVLNNGGLILLSGFYTHDVPLVQDAFPGTTGVRQDSRDEWAMLMLRKE